MPADLTLNTFTPHRWARVVSGDTWAEYAVGPSGMVEAKTTRGPLIVWTTKPGEGESLPPLHAPTPSPLEAQAARVNMRPHFLAFVRAAHGKVRHSVRWKDRRKQIVFFNITLLYGFFALDGWLCNVPESIYRRSKRCGRSRKPIMERAVYEYHVASLIGLDEQPVEDLTKKARSLLQYIRKNGKLPTHTVAVRGNTGSYPVWEIQPEVWLKVLGIYPNLFREALRILRRVRPSLMTSVTLRALEAAAYRAHLSRRVPPPARRARIPRPLYARPRPPTAPLAPPVTC